jgi:hypothetical protein
LIVPVAAEPFGLRNSSQRTPARVAEQTLFQTPNESAAYTCAM